MSEVSRPVLESDPKLPTLESDPIFSLESDPTLRMASGSVRTAGLADVPELVRLINAAYRVEDFFIDGDRTDADDVRAHMQVPGAVFLVADRADGTGLAACVHVVVSGARGHFGLLSVDPVLQRTGLGRALVVAAEDYCREAGCREMDLVYVNVRDELPPFYRRMGYRETGATSPLPVTGGKLKRPAHLVEMLKSL